MSARANRTSSRLGRPALDPTSRCTIAAAPPADSSDAATPTEELAPSATRRDRAESEDDVPEAPRRSHEVRRRSDEQCGRHAEPCRWERRRGRDVSEQPLQLGPRSRDHTSEHQPERDADDDRQHHVASDLRPPAGERRDEHDECPQRREVAEDLPHAGQRVGQRPQEGGNRSREPRFRDGAECDEHDAGRGQREQHDVGGAPRSRLIAGAGEQPQATSDPAGHCLGHRPIRSCSAPGTNPDHRSRTVAEPDRPSADADTARRSVSPVAMSEPPGWRHLAHRWWLCGWLR